MHGVFTLVTKLTERLNSLLDKYAEWLLSTFGKVVSLAILTLFTCLCGWNLQFLEFDFELEKFFPKDHPESNSYKKHVAQFGYDNDFLHIILENEKGVFDPDFLSRSVAFEESLTTIEDVIRVYSPLSLQHVIKSPTGLVIFPLIHEAEADKLGQDSTRIFGNPLYRSAFGADGKSISIYLNHSHFNDPERSAKIIASIQGEAAKNNLQNIRLVGKLSAASTFINYIQKDFSKYLLASLLLSFLLLLFIFKNGKVAILPFLISLLSIVWLFGTMGLMHVKINLLSSLLPPILFFVSMSDAVHLLNALSRNSSLNGIEKVKKSLNEVWLPTLLTSITTAVGFLSLLWINTQPVQVLGVFAALGILMAFIITFTLGIVFSFGWTSTQEVSMTIPKGFSRMVIKKRKYVITALFACMIITIPGLFMLKVDAYLLEDLPKESAVRNDFSYADDYLGGSKPYEMRVDLADSSSSIWDKEVMDQIVKIEHYLQSEYPISKVQSPSTIIKYLHMVNNGGLNSNYRYPTSEKDYQKVIRLKNRIDPKRMNKLVSDDGKSARLIGFFPELGSLETSKRNEQLLSYLQQNIAQDIISYKITGTTYLIDKSHELLSRNLLKGIATAIVVIGLILGIYFRSFKLIFISLIPNFIPLIVIAGIIGLAGISLNMTIAIIFTIVFGIAVDDTIHMVSHFMRKNGTYEEKLELTFTHAGNALLITTVVVSIGFLLFLFSSFGATFYMGLFITLALVIALMTDLTVLPLLLKLWSKEASSAKRGLNA